MKRVSPSGVAIRSNVIGRRAVTALAGDAKLRRLRVDLLGEERLGSPGRAQRGLALGGVTRDADGVPTAAFRKQRQIRRVHHCRTSRDPAIIGHQANRRELTEQASMTGGIPIDLLMMRSGRHHHLPRDARRRCALAIPIGIVEFSPELTTTTLEPHRVPWYVGYLHVV